MDPQWHIAFLNIATTDLAGVTFRHYYSCPEATLTAQLKAREEAERRWGVGRFVHTSLDVPGVEVTTLFGMRRVFSEDDEVPWTDPASNPFTDMNDVDAVPVLAPADCPVFAAKVKAWEYYNSQGIKMGLGAGAASTVTDACDVSGNAFLTALIEAPELAHRLLERITDAHFAIRDWCQSITGVPVGGAVGDDFAGLLSPSMFREFVMPQYHRVYEGASRIYMHSELLNVEHLRIIRDDLGFDEFHGAGTEKVTFAEMYEVLGHNFWVQLTPHELAHLSPNEIRERIKVLANSRAMAVQLYPGRLTPPENMEAALDACREECPGGPRW
ncbi:MAG: hypothetical protein HN742_08105 [Lentisphaerae bacterium]|jgi:hypothetical protein|nr:hypothetical protein [Lentisphaerota bacterium]MBT5613065.1 hypothetical protein [Lentisphaerota bacterium]MBT7059324.1 hypothetical protein [Lentisphaerota bacterium]MBT7841820.1 hypothetical protein [Lentisphaerota bacterium]